MELFNVYPLVDITPVRALGAKLWDEHGQEYLDFYGGHAVISIGHSHPHYVHRLTEQLRRIGFYSNSVQIPLQAELARKLGQAAGYEDYALFLCNSGAEANENALKLASFYTGKARVVAFRGAFHGRTSGAVAATDNAKIVAPFNAGHAVSFVDYDLAAVAEVLRGSEVCAVIIEPIQGVSGIIRPSDDFLQGLSLLCGAHNVILIADEVQCGYGRSGKFFAHQHAGIRPDIISVAKGMGNGFPIGGILVAPHVNASYGLLGTTFGGNHLACAAALAVLEVIEQENLLVHATALGHYLRAELQAHAGAQEIRGRGLMVGVKYNFPVKDLRDQLLTEYHIFVGNAADPTVLRLLPPLNITKAEIDEFLQALFTLTNGPFPPTRSQKEGELVPNLGLALATSPLSLREKGLADKVAPLHDMPQVKLVLEDGTEIQGTSFGAFISAAGEVVFSTAMTGYPENLTDPSFAGQILVLTTPMVGNYGVPGEELYESISRIFESDKVHVAGLVVNYYSEEHSHWNAAKSLGDWLKEYNIPGICGVDTRMLTKKLREKGALLGKIVAAEDVDFYDPNLDNLVAQVSPAGVQHYGSGQHKIVLVDCGTKTNIIRCFLTRDVELIRVPWDYDFTTLDYDGLFLSNGPGNPKMCEATIQHLQKALQQDRPIFGICLGSQLMGLAAGGDTFKLKYGHRSHNQPVQRTGTQRCYITSQNHGFAVDPATLPAEWDMLFENLNDGTCEGIKHKTKPFFSTQFHPEAAGGPQDTEFLFDDFLKAVMEYKDAQPK